MTTVSRIFFAAVLLLAAPACSSSEEEEGSESSDRPTLSSGKARSRSSSSSSSAAPSAAATAEATKIFQTRCTPCHGATGRGDGATAKGLTPPPRDFSSAAWQSGITDENIERVITLGGMGVGKSPAMPPNPDLTAKPEIVKALRAHIRGLRQ
jgi:mono/diheme cytochrome c family protein